MDRKKAQAIIEAVLFAMGESVEVSDLADVLEESEAFVREILEEMQVYYAAADRGIQLIELEDSVQLCTKDEHYDALIKIANAPKKQVLTDALLETLSIIAYKQPVTRLDVEKIRGVNSDHGISRLVELGLIQELGRLDAPGRPLLFGTTEQFLRSFGVKSIDELPEVSSDLMADFKVQAEQEMQLKLDI
ncbi:MAG: SMC-Scp complex subunit ScpB [Lachnospiraceae bacterium]|nr:SMC-Scp complex subunit ScpB [Lachnospiraceae bacterium]